MLNCIYHPTEEMRVVHDDEYQRLLETGMWFKHPNEAKEVRRKFEEEIKNERISTERKIKKSKQKL